jgi:hypothetical protein
MCLLYDDLSICDYITVGMGLQANRKVEETDSTKRFISVVTSKLAKNLEVLSPL